ncbi:MAG TPA: diacylglycerol kinase family protein [Polyangia bacterium]|nr:diacylglycerol kinase family protein [Polyangia bacterium]
MKSAIRLAVVAHSGKTFGGGLAELRKVLASAGHRQPIWCEVSKSSKAKKAVRRVLKKGANLVFVWGGDGMVQKCIDQLAGKDVPLAIIPAGTANLLAGNLGIPKDIAKAVRVGLHSTPRTLDVGVVNGERFAVMAGTGFDALVMRDVDASQKEQMGRVAYLRSGIKAMRARRVRVKIRVDGAVWFKGKISCALLGNVGTVGGGLEVFPDASPTDGMMEVGVVTANRTSQWLRVFSRLALGRVDRSPFVKTTRGKKIVVELERKMPFELDGGARPSARRLKVRVEPGAIRVCAPASVATKRPPRAKARSRRAVAPAPRTVETEQAAAPPTEAATRNGAPTAGERPSVS